MCQGWERRLIKPVYHSLVYHFHLHVSLSPSITPPPHLSLPLTSSVTHLVYENTPLQPLPPPTIPRSPFSRRWRCWTEFRPAPAAHVLRVPFHLPSLRPSPSYTASTRNPNPAPALRVHAAPARRGLPGRMRSGPRCRGRDDALQHSGQGRGLFTSFSLCIHSLVNIDTPY
ncbi:hypothetical protein BV22DRAFT_1040720 [Leucogyrophana mollusca]|uniref:Uncharacterized protein n=1 Tax=Leucogyrophana mollusca TaxID=85980 RepID=A0ACB8B373_9AGAM|nr:hypothetical protein BV22DRAFT_1040720 [Leucogyrophana mollusca]